MLDRGMTLHLRFVGLGKHDIAFVRSGSGCTPSSPMMYPANCRRLPISNFFFNRVMFNFWQVCAIVSTRILSSGRESAQTRMSSTIFFAQGSLSRTVFDRQHHSSEDAFSPWGTRK